MNHYRKGLAASIGLSAAIAVGWLFTTAATFPLITPATLSTLLGCAANQVLYDSTSSAVNCTSDLTFATSSHTLTVGTAGNANSTLTSASATSAGNGTQLNLKSGTGNTGGSGGAVVITAGNGGTSSGGGGSLTASAGNAGGGNAAGGLLSFQSGNGSGSGKSGDIGFSAGIAGATGAGGSAAMSAGNGRGGGAGGELDLAAGGASGAGQAGNAVISAGQGATAALSGDILLTDPNLNNVLVIDRFGNAVCTCANATGATDGFFYMGTSAGAPTGVPAHTTGIYANSVPTRYDTTNNRLMVYNGGWKNVADAPTNPTLSGTSASIGGGALAAGACASGTASVTGATTSMVATSSPNTYPGDGAVWSSQVTSANTVTVRVCAIVALTPTASTYNVRVIQ